MDAEALKRLIRSGETLIVEFKGEKRRQLSDREIYEAVVCLANAEGGTLLIGVENDGTITGSRPRHGGITDADRLCSAIFNNTEPAVSVKAAVVNIGKEMIIVIEVPRMVPQVCCTKDGKCVRRVIGAKGPECIPYYPHQQRSNRINVGDVDYSAHLIEGASLKDLNPLEIERLRQTIRQQGGETRLLELGDEDLIKALRLVETQSGNVVLNIAGLLLVGQIEALQKYVPTHQVAFQVLEADKEVRVNDWFREPLINTLEQIETRFRNLNKEREAQVGFVRVPIPDYSPDAFREAVLNAVQHRNYALLNNVYIQMHPDHLSIASPGGFPEGITVSNLLVHEPKPRNARLSEVMRRIGLVETTGRGIDKIYFGQLRYGRGAPDYSRSDAEAVRLVLMGGRESSRFAAFVAEQEKSYAPLTLDDLLLLDHLRYERRIDSATAGRLTQRGMTHGRATLERLNERGFVEARGEKRGRVYHLSASLYEQLGLKSGYIRAKGFDRIKQEAMVLEYARVHGRVTRSEAAELCNLGNAQAYRLLHGLTKKGKLILRGTKRGSYYEVV